jgi:UrcA family protein
MEVSGAIQDSNIGWRDAVPTRCSVNEDQSATRNQQLEIAMNKLTALTLAGFATVLCANAQAGTVSDAPTVTVRYVTADVANSASAAVLYRRIDAAAVRVCGERLAPGSPFLSRNWKQCVQGAMHDALAQINSPAVGVYAAAHAMVGLDSATASRN